MPRPCWCATARIAAVGAGRRWRTRRGIDVRRVDLAGRTAAPAFLDAHSHFTAVANQFLQVSLEGLHLLGGHAGPDPGLHPAGAHPCRAVGNGTGYDHNLPQGGATRIGSAWMRRRRTTGGDLPPVRPHGRVQHRGAGAAGCHCGYACPRRRRRHRTGEGHPHRLHGGKRLSGVQKRVPMRALESFLAAYRKAQDLYASLRNHHRAGRGCCAGSWYPCIRPLLWTGP